METLNTSEHFADEAQQSFLVKTYVHLTGAILLFAAFEAVLFTYTSLPETFLATIIENPLYWLLVLALYGVAGGAGRAFATAPTFSKPMQYAGFFFYIGVEAIVFTPILAYAAYYAGDPSLLAKAAYLTVGAFITLSIYVVKSGRDFTFLGGILWVGFLVALGLIVSSIVLGFPLGLWFSAAMILYAVGLVLYDTSVIHKGDTFAPDQYLAASLHLFSSLMLMFWYVLRVMLQVHSD